MNRIALALAALAVCAAGCGGRSPSSASAPSTGPTGSTLPRPLGTFAFRASPIDPGVVEFIAPLGNLNPPAHTLPTDHIYLYHRLSNPSAPQRTVVAPADGTIQSIITHTETGGGDVKLLIAAAPPFSYYLDHVIPDASLREGLAIVAGQRLGMTATGQSFGIDLGVFSDGVTVAFANPSRYVSESLHGDSPIKYFDEPLRSQLYALVRRSSGDRDGTFNYDIPGRLSGNWFSDQLSPSQTQLPANWGLHLSFAYDNFDPSILRISSGGALGFSGTPTVTPGAPEPRDVSVATGKVVYHLFNPGSPSPYGVLVVQMLAADRIRIEFFAGDRPDADFTASARTYVR